MRPRRPPRRRGLLLNAFFAAAIAAALLLGPRFMDGRAAFEWTRYHASRGPAAGRAAEQARHTAQWAVLALERTAPLAFGTEAARLALGLGRNVEARDRAAALALYGEVRAALERLRGSPLRGMGLAELAAEAKGLEQRARSALGVGDGR